MTENDTAKDDTEHWEDKEGTVPPEGYELYDHEQNKYICAKCDSRLLRIADYAECNNCGARYRRLSNDE